MKSSSKKKEFIFHFLIKGNSSFYSSSFTAMGKVEFIVRILIAIINSICFLQDKNHSLVKKLQMGIKIRSKCFRIKFRV